MADDQRAGERAYREIKQAILKGELRLRQRLDIESLAKRFGVSATPVRQALAILTTERLVSTGSARGYRVAFWSETDLKALYVWRAQLARLAAETYAPRPIAEAAWRGEPHEDAFAAIMDHLAFGASDEIRRAARSADERLRAALRAEPQALSLAQSDLEAVVRAMGPDERNLQARVKRYFQRRFDHAGAIRAAAHALALPANGD